jgi:hypothetical protein
MDHQLGEFKARTIRCGECEMTPAFGSTAQKTLAVPQRFVFVIASGFPPGWAGEVGRISAPKGVNFYGTRQSLEIRVLWRDEPYPELRERTINLWGRFEYDGVSEAEKRPCALPCAAKPLLR